MKSLANSSRPAKPGCVRAFFLACALAGAAFFAAAPARAQSEAGQMQGQGAPGAPGGNGGNGGSSGQAGGQGEHRGPPPEALSACQTRKAAETCSFESPHGNVSGTCWAPEGKPLACRPSRAAAPNAR